MSAFKRAEARHVLPGDVVKLDGRWRRVTTTTRRGANRSGDVAISTEPPRSRWRDDVHVLEPGAIVRVRVETSTPAPARR